MRILFVARSLFYGGAERQLVELARGLQRHGHDVSVALFYGGQPLESELVAAGVRIHDLAKRGRWDVAGFLARLTRLLRRERPDIVHGYLTVPNLLVAMMRPILRCTPIVWGLRAADMDLSHYDRLARVTERSLQTLGAVPDLLVVNSHAGRAHYARAGLPEARMVVIENGIDTRRFAPDPGRRTAVRSRWCVADSVHVVGLVGRLDPIKDHPTFLAAAALAARERADLRFVCVGDGPADYGATLRRQAETLGLSSRLQWIAATRDPAEIYNALDVAVSASTSEGFSNVIGEAMACGVPCVVTDVGDSARLVAALGRVVGPGNPEALGRAVVDLVRDLDAGAVDHAAIRRHIVDRYSIDQLVSRTESRLACLLAEHTASCSTR
jgi:glycosyltransferase involved in cell wall biosynthesis